MLEDCTMEKKPTARSNQAQAKNVAPESKKNQDAVGGKVLPRARRRESTGSGGSPAIKYESARKPIPTQKNKCFDKRPRPRGQYSCFGKEDTKVAEPEAAESYSAFAPGNKKQNLNHLLNFHYAPRGSSTSVLGSRSSQRSHKHKYNKEHFLQANCQFVVKSSGDYSAYLSDPDTLVDWDLVEQIRVHTSEDVICPICLSPPIAGKMTRCGHVFCWPCILHYLALSDKTWRRCPICFEAVDAQGLKSAVSVPHSEVSVGSEVTMLLMCRERGSLVATPVGQARPADQLLSVSETALDTVYSKLLLATSAEVSAMLARERGQLETQLREEQGCPELCFTEQALEMLSQRLGKLELMAEICGTSVPEARALNELVFEEMPQAQPALVYKCAFDDDAEQFEVTESMPTPPSGKGRDRYESLGSSDGGYEQHLPAAKQFYFYQASDGQHLYLRSLNVRMLEMQYGSLGRCPPVIRGRLLEKEACSMTEELRKRLRCLQHLSVTCQFELAEIELRPPFVARDILAYFQDQLAERRRRRQTRAKQERQRERKINEVEGRRYGTTGLGPIKHSNLHIDSTEHFPQYSEDALGSSPVDVAVAMEALEIAPPEPYGGPSFAQMLRAGPPPPSAAWPTVARKPAAEEEGSAPAFNQSFSAAVALALERAQAQQQEPGDGAQGSRKKKKKGKKTLLFTTTMACSGK